MGIWKLKKHAGAHFLPAAAVAQSANMQQKNNSTLALSAQSFSKICVLLWDDFLRAYSKDCGV